LGACVVITLWRRGLFGLRAAFTGEICLLKSTAACSRARAHPLIQGIRHARRKLLSSTISRSATVFVSCTGSGISAPSSGRI
jgi:hypothetical protein